MGRYQYPAYETAKTPRYVVVWSLHWCVIKCQPLEAGTDLSAAMDATIECLRRDGWHAESDAVFGFVFIHNDTERRLLMLTSRDPADNTRQSFNPHR